MWAVSPSPAVRDGRLYDAAALSATEAWAVGETAPWQGGDSQPGPATPLVEHWNGSQWSVVATDVTAGSLEGVAALASDDVWAVGRTPAAAADNFPVAYATGDGTSVLIEHWDGKAWTRSATSFAGTLRAVAATAPDDAWAVGGGRDRGLILHWDGTTWTQVATPRRQLRDVVAVSARSVWAVGAAETLHWDGVRWRVVPVPRRVGRSTGPPDLTAVSAGWAVGTAPVPVDSPMFTGQAAVLHWNGRRWIDLSPVRGDLTPSDVSGSAGSWVAATDEGAWMLGSQGGSALFRRTAHGWFRQALARGRRIERLAVIPGGGLWAVGYATAGEPSDELVGAFDHTTPLIERLP